MTRLRPGPVLAVAALGALALAPLLVANYVVFILTIALINVILTLGLNLLMGYAGQISLANASFFTIGAYVTVFAATRLGLPFVVAVAAAVLVSAAVGFCVGLPALRVSGHYLALVTLAFAVVVQVVAIDWVAVTGGPAGVKAPRASLGLGLFRNDVSYFYLVLAVASGLFVVAYNVVHSGLGRALVAVRDTEVGAQSVGVSLARYKTIAFALSAGFAAIAGALQVGLLQFVDPAIAGIWPSFWHIIYVVVGGAGTLGGSVVGPLLLTWIPTFLSEFREYTELIFGAVLFVTLWLMPRGIAGTVGRWWRERTSHS